MTYKVVGKEDGKLLVEFVAENGQEALILAMATNPPEVDAHLGANMTIRPRVSISCESNPQSQWTQPNVVGSMAPILRVKVGAFELGTAEPLR